MRSRDFVTQTVATIVSLFKHYSEEERNSPSLQQKIMEAVIYELEFVEQLPLLEVYAQFLPAIVDFVGANILYFTKRLIPKLLLMIDTKSQPLVVATCAAIDRVIFHAWPRMDAWSKQLFGAFVFVYIEWLDDDVDEVRRQRAKRKPKKHETNGAYVHRSQLHNPTQSRANESSNLSACSKKPSNQKHGSSCLTKLKASMKYPPS